MEQLIDNIRRSHQKTCIEGRLHVDHELLRQSCVHQMDREWFYAYQAERDEIARTRCQHNSKELVLQAESHDGSQCRDDEDADDDRTEFVEMIPKRKALTRLLRLGSITHPFYLPSCPLPNSLPRSFRP